MRNRQMRRIMVFATLAALSWTGTGAAIGSGYLQYDTYWHNDGDAIHDNKWNYNDTMGMAVDPATGYPNLVWVELTGNDKPGSDLYYYDLHYSWFDGLTWSDQVFATYRGDIEPPDGSYPSTVKRQYIDDITLTIMDNGVAGIAYSRMEYTIHFTNSYTSTSTFVQEIFYIPINLSTHTLGSATNILGMNPSWSLPGGVTPLIYCKQTRLSLSYSPDGRPGIVFSENTRYLGPPEVNHTQLCYRFLTTGGTWAGSSFSAGVFSNAIDTNTDYTYDATARILHLIQVMAGVSLEIDNTNTWHVAYGSYDYTESFRDIRYAKGTPSGSTISWTKEDIVSGVAMDPDIDYTDIHVSIAIDKNAGNKPCVAYDASDTYYKERVNNAWTPPQLVYDYSQLGAEDNDQYSHVGSLVIDPDCNKKWISVGIIGRQSQDSYTLAFHQDGANWKMERAVWYTRPEWRAVMDLDPNYCKPVVATNSSHWGGVASIQPNFDIIVLDVRDGSAINNATVTISGPDPRPADSVQLNYFRFARRAEGTYYAIVTAPNFKPGAATIVVTKCGELQQAVVKLDVTCNSRVVSTGSLSASIGIGFLPLLPFGLMLCILLKRRIKMARQG